MTPPPNDLAVTWWGHATATVEIGGIRIATDPVLVDRLFHLRRYGVTPRAEAREADLILLSHLHGDHIHLRSLRRFGPQVPVVAPHGARRLLRRLGLEDVRTVAPGDIVDVRGARIEVLHEGLVGRDPIAVRVENVTIAVRRREAMAVMVA